MYFVVEDVLAGDDLERAKRLAHEARFIDGRASANAPASVKNNVEMEIGEGYAELCALVGKAIEASTPINLRVLPRFRTSPIVNRYDVGMFYAQHVDAPIQGGVTQLGRSAGRYGQNFVRTDYSMTLFLAPPESYEGGELELNVLDEVKLVKLRAGSAVCYSTGIPHAVRKVTRGTRIAAVCWFQSMIRDVTLRRALWDQYQLHVSLLQAGHRELAERASAVHSNLLRHLADI